MSEPSDSNALIGSDAPQTDPADDAFGYAPFARRIADAICKAPSPQGLVMAIHGPWGSGKSTLLNYVKHNLGAFPESDRPIVVDFNPWWFKGHDQLAGQFLAQFAAKLPHESVALRAIGDAMAEYSGAIGTVIMAAYPIPYLDKAVAWALKLFKHHVKDVPALKAEVAKALTNAEQRFVFVLDDIDRLAPDEIRELFKVVKALADFPNVIYLLAFDRDVVAASLNTSLGVDGETYLEKIVQAPFALPSVDRQKLQQKLFADLDRVLSGTDESLFDSTHWGNIYHDGLDQFIQKPRDIVRVMNVLSVTYPAVRGEVNPVDFIALEFLRVFLPEVYGTVRDHRDRFAGHSSESFRDDRTGVRAFHDGWLATVPEPYRAGARAMLERLFPKLEGVWSNMTYPGDWEKRWRRELRVCSPTVFPIYFQFGVSADSLSRQELDALVMLGGDVDGICAELLAAIEIRRPDGSSKAREYLSRLLDLEDALTPEFARAMLAAVFRVGDDLLLPGDESGGFLAIHSIWRVLWLVQHLLERLPTEERDSTLIELLNGATALCVSVDVAHVIDESIKKGVQPGGRVAFATLSQATADRLKAMALGQIRYAAQHGQLLSNTNLPFILHRWKEWASADEVGAWIQPLIADDDVLLTLLERHLQYGTSQGWSDRVARRVPSLNPQSFEPFVDLATMEERVRSVAKLSGLPREQGVAAEMFLKSMDRIHKGQDPSGFFVLDEDK